MAGETEAETLQSLCEALALARKLARRLDLKSDATRQELADGLSISSISAVRLLAEIRAGASAARG